MTLAIALLIIEGVVAVLCLFLYLCWLWRRGWAVSDADFANAESLAWFVTVVAVSVAIIGLLLLVKEAA